MEKNQIHSFLKNHYLFLLILAAAVFLRVFRLDELTTFGGDQGIDFLTVKDMVLHHKWTLLGIKTSIAPFFQGPLYLYMLFPFFLLFHLQPIAGPIAAVSFSTISIILLYITVRNYFSQDAALFSTALFAVSPELITFGNTPLYQNFLPLFIIVSIYVFLSKKKNVLVGLLLGLTAGLGMELHFLNVSLALALLIYILFTKQRWSMLGGYIMGLIIGLSPTLFFELRHQFLNTHLFLDYQATQHVAISLSNIFYQWVKGTAVFLGGNSMIIGSIILIGMILALIFIKKTTPHYSELRKLTLILIAVTFLLSLKLPTFGTHYALPIWIMFIILIPVLILKSFDRRKAFVILGLFILVNLFVSVKQLGNNHGYTMPDGWTMRKINQIGKIVSQDSKTHRNFNVASLLDGNTRTYPVRYTTEINGAVPDQVENYPVNDHLYVAFGPESKKLFTVTTWEVTSLSPFTIGTTWNLGDNIYLYRLDRIKTAP